MHEDAEYFMNIEREEKKHISDIVNHALRFEDMLSVAESLYLAPKSADLLLLPVENVATDRVPGDPVG